MRPKARCHWEGKLDTSIRLCLGRAFKAVIKAWPGVLVVFTAPSSRTNSLGFPHSCTRRAAGSKCVFRSKDRLVEVVSVMRTAGGQKVD